MLKLVRLLLLHAMLDSHSVNSVDAFHVASSANTPQVVEYSLMSSSPRELQLTAGSAERLLEKVALHMPFDVINSFARVIAHGQ
jgi:hypothetical protein